MAALMPTALPTPANYSTADTPIYISSATLQLKQNVDLNAYKWQTVVITAPPAAAPPQQPEALAPEVKVQVKEVAQQCQTANKQHKKPAPPPPPPRSNQHWTPAKMHDVPQTIAMVVNNFMDSERYHSMCNKIPTTNI